MAETYAQDLLKAFPDDLRLFTEGGNPLISGVSSQENPQADHIVYAADLAGVKLAIEAGAACIVTAAKLEKALSDLNFGKTAVLLASDVKLMMALLNQKFFPVPNAKHPFEDKNIHSSAVVHPHAVLGDGVRVGPGVVISAHVKIGDRSQIGANTVIEANTQLGTDCYIHPLVHISHSCILGDRVEVKSNTTIGGDGFGYAHGKGGFHRVPHYGAVIIENDVHIGSGVNIDRGTFKPSRIGAHTKIDNHCHLGHNIEIGKNCLVTAGMITAGSAIIGDNCVFAGRASVNGHISICDGVTIGPLSGVTNDIKEPGVYAGFPVLNFKDFLKVQASLASLPRIRRSVSQILKKLGLEE